MKKPFYELTNLGRARRLRIMAGEALTYYDLEVSAIKLITNDFNGIFRVDTRDRNKYLLRIALPEGGHDIQNFKSEIEWLQALQNDPNLCLPKPIQAKNGEWLVTINIDGIPEPRHCMLFSWVPGRILAEDLTPDNVFKLGKLSAQMHQLACDFIPSSQFTILKFDKVFPFPEPILLFNEEYKEIFPTNRLKIYEKGIEWAQAMLNQLNNSQTPMIVLHGDLHQWNVHIYRKKLCPIDFEDLMWGWPVQDIATTLYYFIGMSEYNELKTAFTNGYTQISPWPEQTPGEIDAFIAARGIGLVNFVLQDPNPDWQAETANFAAKTEIHLQSLLSAHDLYMKRQ